MHNKIIKNTVKATIIDIIVALFITAVIISGMYLFFGARIDNVISLIDTISVDIKNDVEEKETVITEKKIKNYPKFGTQYATIEIPSIDVNLPVYVGETLEILKSGVGHYTGSYFPGEGGSIIYMGHNFKNFFRRFSELKLDDEIIIKANYGEFRYKIYDMQIVNETETDKLPIQKEQEIFMVYTCYPFNNIGYATQRYVVYAEPVE